MVKARLCYGVHEIALVGNLYFLLHLYKNKYYLNKDSIFSSDFKIKHFHWPSNKLLYQSLSCLWCLSLCSLLAPPVNFLAVRVPIPVSSLSWPNRDGL